VVLFSGGVDSATAAALALRDGFDVHALSFDYGQRHRHELTAARRVAEALGAARHEVVAFDLRPFGGSALTDDIAVPRADRERQGGIPCTYVPARNTIFLSFALAWAETLRARDIFIGVNATDFAGYPDCRPSFIAAFEQLARAGTKSGVEGAGMRVRAPLI